MQKDALILLVDQPTPGKVKPKLIPYLGEENATKMYISLLDISAQVIKSLFMHKEVFYEDQIREGDMFDSIAEKNIQVDGDWGTKVKHGFEIQFEKGYTKVIYIDSDCPVLKDQHIKQALVALDENDAVMGPSLSGGYYLLGLKAKNDALFENKIWGSSNVFEETLKELHLQHQKVFLLEALFNVDTLDDLQRYLVYISSQNNALNPLKFKDRPQ